MVRFRRSPWLQLLAVLLMIGSPGLGGAALQGLHGCAERMPWLADGVADAASGHHAGGHEESPAEQGCHCIGQCQATAVMASPAPGALARANDLPAAPSTRFAESRIAPAGRVPHRLPPATAPPLL